MNICWWQKAVHDGSPYAWAENDGLSMRSIKLLYLNVDLKKRVFHQIFWPGTKWLPYVSNLKKHLGGQIFDRGLAHWRVHWRGSTSLHVACPKELEAASRSSKTYLAIERWRKICANLILASRQGFGELKTEQLRLMMMMISSSMRLKSGWRDSQNYFILQALKLRDRYKLCIDKGGDYIEK